MRRHAIALIGLATLLGACGSGSHNSTAPTTSGASQSQSPRFVDQVDNPWFPLIPGSAWVYRGVKDGERSRDVVRVTGASRVIDGVRCTAVSDRLYLKGALEERTTDWYAQDADGNVWYYGEATAELSPSGAVKTREGSWLTGRNGAKPGIFMPAQPEIGQRFRQEYLEGHAEDHFEVLSLSASVHTPAASSNEALLTKEWTPLEPDVIDHKLYVKGYGTVKEQTVKGGKELNVLVSFQGG
jgi:hypothetical protein